MPDLVFDKRIEECKVRWWTRIQEEMVEVGEKKRSCKECQAFWGIEPRNLRSNLREVIDFWVI